MELFFPIPVPLSQEVKATARRTISYQDPYQNRTKGRGGRLGFGKALTKTNHPV
jgi:hypothetical protein